MANVLIVQLFMNLFYKSETEFNLVQHDIEKCKNEFISAYKDESIKVICISCLADLSDAGKGTIEILELKKTGTGVEFLSKDGFEPGRLTDPGDVANLVYIFDKLQDEFKPAIKILSTYDHGYGFIMSRQPTKLDHFKMILSNEHLITYLQTIRSSHGKKGFNDLHFTEEQQLKFEQLETYLNKDNIDNRLNVEMSFTKLETATLINLPSGLRTNYSESFIEEPIEINMNAVTALTVNELRNAINTSSIKYFDVIIMLNCFMQTVDTAYALKDHCNYLVASETGNWFAGYDYAELMNITSVDDAFFKRFIDASVSKLKKADARMLDDLVITALKLPASGDYFETAIKAIKRLIFLNNNKKLGSSLVIARLLSFDVTERTFLDGIGKISLVDMLCLLKNAAKIINDAELSELVDKTESTYNSVKKAGFASPFYQGQSIDFGSGMSIFFPGRIKEGIDQLDDLQTSFYYFAFLTRDARIPSAFSDDSGWGRFLMDYYIQLLESDDN